MVKESQIHSGGVISRQISRWRTIISITGSIHTGKWVKEQMVKGINVMDAYRRTDEIKVDLALIDKMHSED